MTSPNKAVRSAFKCIKEAVHAVPRCPMLKNLAVGFLEPEHMPWFRAFLAFGGEKLQRLQLQLSMISFDPEDDVESDYEEDRDPDRCPTEDESEWESSEGDFDEESDPDAYPYWGQRIKRQPFHRPPPRPRQKFERVLGSLEWSPALEHLQLVFHSAWEEHVRYSFRMTGPYVYGLLGIGCISMHQLYNQSYSFDTDPHAVVELLSKRLGE